jgi:integrase
MGYIRDRWKDPTRKGKGRRWQVKYQVDGCEKDGGSYDVKEVAKRRLVELEASVHRGQWVDPTDQTTVAEYARRWAAARPFRPTTARRVELQIRLYIEGTPLGTRRLGAVRPSEVQSWAAELSQRLAPATVAMIVTMLKTIYRAAELDRLVSSSPVARVALPRTDRPRVTPLTVDQVRALAAAVPDRCRAMVLAQAGLGLRIGELLALRACDVDFLRRTVRIEHQLARLTRQRVDPKTPRSRRTVPLPAFVGEALAEHRLRWPPLADGSIFYGHNDEPYHHTHYGTRVFKAAVSRLASTAKSSFPADTTPHDLRHHYASVLLAGGESVVAVAERLGHDNATMVIKVYGHLLPDSEDRTRRVVDQAWSRGSGEFPTAQGRPG